MDPKQRLIQLRLNKLALLDALEKINTEIDITEAEMNAVDAYRKAQEASSDE
nr:hypothetical protein 3 [Deltaproteobacteria bacterium]